MSGTDTELVLSATRNLYWQCCDSCEVAVRDGYAGICAIYAAESGCLAITGARTTLGSRNFAVAEAKIWNSLPVDLRLLSQSLRTFGHKLKHYLFVDEP